MHKMLKRFLVLLLLLTMIVPQKNVMAKESPQVFSYSGHAVTKGGDWWYYILDDKSGAVVCGYEGKKKHIKIPDKLGGKKVTCIERIAEDLKDGEFWNTKVKSVVMPDTVVQIANSAFDGCMKLEKITLSKNIKQIDPMAFYGCENLKKVNIPEGIKKINAYTFYGCKSLDGIIIPEGVKK